MEHRAISHHGRTAVRDITCSYRVSSDQDRCIFLSKTIVVLTLTPPTKHWRSHEARAKFLWLQVACKPLKLQLLLVAAAGVCGCEMGPVDAATKPRSVDH